MTATHVVPPGEGGAGGRVGPDVALEVDVVALLDPLRVQARPEGQPRHRHVCKGRKGSVFHFIHMGASTYDVRAQICWGGGGDSAKMGGFLL